MTTEIIIAQVSDPVFYSRVAFLALKAAQSIATEGAGYPNHSNRVAYANKIFRGEESGLNLAMHVVASNPTITSTIINSGNEAVSDGDIEFALATIWDARANAFKETFMTNIYNNYYQVTEIPDTDPPAQEI